jgi:hypothetical protein
MRDAQALAGLAAAGVLPNLAYLAIGLAATRLLGLRGRGAEALAQAFVLGTGFASLALLGLRGLDIPVPLWAVALVALAGAPLLRGVASADPGGRRLPAPGWARRIDAVTVGIALVSFASALGPETFWDAFEYHLPLVRAWCEGPIRALPGVLDAELRAGVDLLYVPALTAGQVDAAAAVSACFAAALAALIRSEVARRASPGAGSLAALFSLLVPFTLETAASSYVDLGVGAYGFLALLWADRWNRGGEPRDLWLSALCLGFAANGKLHAAVLVPAVLALVLLGGRPPSLRRVALAAGVVALVCAPWLVKQALTTGNPFFPFLGSWLGTGPTTPEHLALRRLRLATDFPEPRGVASFFHYVASLALGRNPHLSGLLGPLPFALLPAAWQRPTRAGAALLGMLAALFVLQFVAMPALRFGAPLLPFVAIGTALGGARLACSTPLAARALCALLLLLAVHHGAAFGARTAPRLLALRDPQPYEDRKFPDQASLRELVRQGHGVVAIPGGAALWMPRPVYLLDWQRNGEIFFDRSAGHLTPPDVALAVLRERGVGSLVVDVPRAGLSRDAVGHPIVDAWIARALAKRRLEVAPRPSRAERVYVLVDLE